MRGVPLRLASTSNNGNSFVHLEVQENVYHEYLVTPKLFCTSILLPLVSWFSASMGMTASNKYLLDTLSFNFPLLVTFLHVTAVALLLRLRSCTYAGAPNEIVTSVTEPPASSRLILIAFLTALELTLSNMACPKVSIPVTMVVKSSLMVVTYAFSIIAGLEPFSGRLFLVVVFIFLSLCFTLSELHIRHTMGVVFLCVSVVAAAVRWILVHEQLKLRNVAPLQLMHCTQPFCALVLMAPAFAIDVPRLFHEDLSAHQIVKALGLTMGSASLAFLVVLSEYRLVYTTSSVSMTVASVGKQAANILMSILVFNETIGSRTVLGLLASVLGIIGYTRMRYTANWTNQQDAPHSIPEAGPKLSPYLYCYPLRFLWSTVSAARKDSRSGVFHDCEL